MHIIFLNPQGNFDKNDSYWTMHPDFGGQLVYVKEIASEMLRMFIDWLIEIDANFPKGFQFPDELSQLKELSE